MAISKVIYGDDTLIDITDSTIESGNMLNGTVGYTSAGVRTVGSVTVPTDLDDLSDVTITSPTDGQALVYDNGDWVNGSVATTVKSFYGTCDTAGDNATKVVTLANTDGWGLKAGVIVGVKFSYNNSASNVTLNVNSSGDKSIYFANAVYTGAATQVCGAQNYIIYYMYDGTYWCFLNISNNFRDSDTHRPIKVNGTQLLGNNNTAVNFKNGTNVTITGSDADITIAATDTNTTYTFAEGSTNGKFTVTPSDGSSAQSVTVHGLGSAAYTESSAYATSSHAHGNITKDGTITSDTTQASGDKLVIIDADNNKVARSKIALSATVSSQSQTTKFLREDGGWSAPSYTSIPSNNVTGSGTSGYLTKFNGANTITNGPQLGSDTTKFLRNDGNWEVPAGTYSLPAATSNALGGIKIGFTQTDKKYPVQLSSQKAYVEVPWTDTSGNDKVAKAGDTMTGDLILYKEGTTAQDYPSILKFINKDTTTGKTSGDDQCYIAAYQDHASGGVNGLNFVLQTGGCVFLGSGESPKNHYAALKPCTSEITYITSDNIIHLQGNANTLANRKGVQITTGGELVPDVADVATNNVGSIGTSSYKWANVYTTKLNGNTVPTGTGTLALTSDIPAAATSNPADVGTSASIGSSAKYAKEDHVHKLPLAASGTRGGIKIGYSENETNYAVKLSSEKAYVTVPWTDTQVTDVAYHYAPAEDASAKLSADASGGSAATWNSTQLVTGVDIKRDAKGHVVGVAVDSIKMPANPDTKLTITETNPTSGTWYYPTWHTAVSGSNVTTLRANNGLRYYSLEGKAATVDPEAAAVQGRAIIALGNATKAGVDGNKRGEIFLYSEQNGNTSLYATPNSVTNRKIYFPDADGTLVVNNNNIFDARQAVPRSNKSVEASYYGVDDWIHLVGTANGAGTQFNQYSMVIPNAKIGDKVTLSYEVISGSFAHTNSSNSTIYIVDNAGSGIAGARMNLPASLSPGDKKSVTYTITNSDISQIHGIQGAYFKGVQIYMRQNDVFNQLVLSINVRYENCNYNGYEIFTKTPTQLTESTKWKTNIGCNITSSSTGTLSNASAYDEILIKGEIASSSITGLFVMIHIPIIALTTANQAFRGGWYQNATGNYGGAIYFNVKKNGETIEASLYLAYLNGETVTSTSKGTMYYR